MKKLLYVLILSLLLLGGCQQLGEQSPSSSSEEPSNIDETREDRGHFFAHASSGDTIGQMVVTEAQISSTYPRSAIVSFRGQILVEGIYRYDPASENGIELAFIVDEASIGLFPIFEEDDRMIWFTFANQEEALHLLQLEKDQFGMGRASILIDDYVIDFRPTDTANTARLVEVKELVAEE